MNVDAIIHHAGWVLFVWVFVNQSGVPVPVVPSLVAAGAALVADMVWYGIGRWHGAQVLSLLGRVLHRPRVWVDHIEHAFHAHEVGFQLWAQFLPQLNPIAAGLAGATGVGLARYIVIASAAAMAWAGTWITVGYLLAAVNQVLPDMLARRSGTILFTTGASSVYPAPRFGVVGAAMAWLRNWARALHDAVAPKGVQVGHVAIGAFIGRQPGATPDAIAPLYWELHTHRHEIEKVFLLDVAEWLPEQTQPSRLAPKTKGR